MSVLLQRTRACGKCPPSLMSEDRVLNDDNFDIELLQLMDMTGFSLRSDDNIAVDFLSVLKKAQSVNTLNLSTSLEARKKILEYRRCVLLALVGGTNRDSPSLTRILANGFLTQVKAWLDEALAGKCGGVDFVLHLLSSIVNLPVTKGIIKDSGLGKAVGSVEKHSIFKGTPNQSPISIRVQKIKDSWHACVKAQKLVDASSKQTTSVNTTGLKRPADVVPIESSSAVKKVKTTAIVDDAKKGSTLSTLLKKVTVVPTGVIKSATKGLQMTLKTRTGSNDDDENNKLDSKGKKSARRVKWADHFGGHLNLIKDDGEDEAIALVEHTADTSAAWSESKKRDRLREKELLSTAKKSKLLDDDEEDAYDVVKIFKPMMDWRTPVLLPERNDITKVNLESTEMKTQAERMKASIQKIYTLDSQIPNAPSQQSDAEQAIDRTIQSSAIISDIPFFVPPLPTPIAPPPPVIASAITANPTSSQTYTSNVGTYPQPTQFDEVATPQFVQSIGLPMFLVGQSKNALQTLSGSPSLLSTLVDRNGMYDQPRLMALVQSLTTSAGGARPLQGSTPIVPYQPQNSFNIPASTGINLYGPSTTYQQHAKPSVMKSTEGNLHVSGYGVGTGEAELIASFSPYVRVDEVVMKGTFAFINTSDPPAAARAKEALTGTLIGGMPIRINQATRKAREGVATTTTPAYGMNGAPPNHSNGTTAFGGVNNNNVSGSSVVGSQFLSPGSMTPTGMPNVDAARDDRGNPATKNLFVAGYGPSTTEQQLRDLISQYVSVVGVVLKGTFSFVNTTDRESAVYAREMLGGMMLNGGAIRINFAKETGRLGTSFDLTYGTNTGPNSAKIMDGIVRPQIGGDGSFGRNGVGY